MFNFFELGIVAKILTKIVFWPFLSTSCKAVYKLLMTDALES